MSSAPAPEYWLHGGVAFDKVGVDRFIGEVNRVMLALGSDPAWSAWWRSASRAPVLELRLFVVRAWASPEAEAAYRYAGVEERVQRGRKQHVVQMVIPAECFSGVSTDRQPGLALLSSSKGSRRPARRCCRTQALRQRYRLRRSQCRCPPVSYAGNAWPSCSGERRGNREASCCVSAPAR